MKIDINRIKPEGVILEEDVSGEELDLETDIVKFRSPVNIKAEVSKITNAVTVYLSLYAKLYMNCSRCLNEFTVEFKKDVRLNYPVSKTDTVLDIDPDIRQEIILDYPLKPLCSPNCLGLCFKCGKNLNEGGCSCGIT